MCKGERAVFRMTSDYAYGEEGSFSFPHVPGGWTVEYEVELVSYEAGEEEDVRGMVFEERVEAAEVRREGGGEGWGGKR